MPLGTREKGMFGNTYGVSQGSLFAWKGVQLATWTKHQVLRGS